MPNFKLSLLSLLFHAAGVYIGRSRVDALFSLAVSAEELEACRAAQRDMMEALKARRAALEDALSKRTEQLKQLCLKEAVSSARQGARGCVRETGRLCALCPEGGYG